MSMSSIRSVRWCGDGGDDVSMMLLISLFSIFSILEWNSCCDSAIRPTIECGVASILLCSASLESGCVVFCLVGFVSRLTSAFGL